MIALVVAVVSEAGWAATWHVAITKDNLTLRGDGPGVTIIGPEVLPPPPPSFEYHGISVTFVYATTLTIRDLQIEHVRKGVFGVCPDLLVENCAFADIVENGLQLSNPSAQTGSELVRY